MSFLSEGRIRITLPVGVVGRKFDDSSHGLSHCMKAVDFVIERSNSILFVELKDPDNQNSQPKDRDKFLQDFQSAKLDDDLKTKCRDSFLYEFSTGQIQNERAIHFVVIICASTLDAALLNARTDSLKRLIPLQGPQGKIWKSIISSCFVLNLEGWNKYFPDLPATRVP
jgi:hypothetical protein